MQEPAHWYALHVPNLTNMFCFSSQSMLRQLKGHVLPSVEEVQDRSDQGKVYMLVV